MDPAEPAVDERAFLRAVARGLADDAAGRVMSTEALKADLEHELGLVAWSATDACASRGQDDDEEPTGPA